MPSIKKLLAEFKEPPVTLETLRRRRVELMRKFSDQYNLSSWEKIAEAIRTQTISESALVDEWIQLQAGLDAMKMRQPERTPKRRHAKQPPQVSRESGSSYFRLVCG